MATRSKKGELFTNDLENTSGAGSNDLAGDGFDANALENLPDQGPNLFYSKIYIKDHGRENDTDIPREPEWVDFTTIENIDRISTLDNAINIGSETNTPFVFKSSTLSITLNNPDFIFDNLKKANLVTVNGNTAKFKSTTEGSNLDLTNCEAKVSAVFSNNEKTIEQELSHYFVKSLSTSSDGKASLTLDSLEKPFLEAQANTVKDGRNWYFDRSVKFLAEKIIKSVRRKYSGTEEVIPTGDKIAIGNVETVDGDRVFSEYGRPIVNIKSTDNTIAGEKRFITTAAVARNIFRSKLQSNISTGSNLIKIRIDVPTGYALTLYQGDVLTIGKESGASFADLNEEKVTVTEDITFTFNHAIQNVKTTSLLKEHLINEIVERWIVYLGVTRVIEESSESSQGTGYPYNIGESYIVAFDPDKDEYANLCYKADTGISNCWQAKPTNQISKEVLRYPLRFLALKQTCIEYGVPTLTKLIGLGCSHSYPGKPNENGNVLVWTINEYAKWDDNTTHLTLNSETLSNSEDGGMYTGEMSFRSMAPVVNNTFMDVDGSESKASALFGAQGVGQFVPETIFPSNFMANAGQAFHGFGYYGQLSADINGTTAAPEYDITVNALTYNNEIMGMHGHPNLTGSLYIIGLDHGDDTTQAIDEQWYQDMNVSTAKIAIGNVIESNKIIYTLKSGIDKSYSARNSIVIIIPDTGKMYLKNVGENLMVNLPQNITIQSYKKDTDWEVGLIDTDNYDAEMIIEKKTTLDGKLSIKSNTKNVLEQSSIEQGYYGALLTKNKMTVDVGDVISEITNIDAAANIRVVPAQYNAQPFNIDDYEFGVPLFRRIPGVPTDTPNEIHDGTKNFIPADTTSCPATANSKLPSGFYNKNMHSWSFPVIGLWVKYDNINESLLAFDDSKISNNGNSELMGYWYLEFASGQLTTQTSRHARARSAIDTRGLYPLMDLAICDAKGMVYTPQAGASFTNLFNDNHMPLCTVLHNVDDTTLYKSTPSYTYDYTGDLNARLLTAIQEIVGGSWKDDYFQYNGASLKFKRWNPDGNEFSGVFPKTLTYDRLAWKFKAVKNPQAKGTLFVSSHCTPVRPYHYHNPINTNGQENFGNSSITVTSGGDRDFNITQSIYDFSINTATAETLFDFTADSQTGNDPEKDLIIRFPANTVPVALLLINDAVRITLTNQLGAYLGTFRLKAKIKQIPAMDQLYLYGIILKDAGYYLNIALNPSDPNRYAYPKWAFGDYLLDLAGAAWDINEEEPYTGFNQYNFEDGSEETQNYLIGQESIASAKLLWVADHFTNNKNMGLVQGVGDSRSSGGFLEGVNITGVSGVEYRLAIPLGHNYGYSNIATLTLQAFSAIYMTYTFGISPVTIDLTTINDQPIYTYLKFPYQAVGVFTAGDIIEVYINAVSVGKFNIIGTQSDGSTYTRVIIKNLDTIWIANSLGTVNNYVKQCTKIKEGDTYRLSGTTGYHFNSSFGYLKVLNVISDTSLKARWIPTPNVFGYLNDYELHTSGHISKMAGSGENVRTVTMLTISNLRRDYANTPMYEPEHLWHVDALPNLPLILKQKYYSSPSLSGFLSIYKINFNTSPNPASNLTYPKALYAKNLHKFWYYNKRITIPYETDGKNDSGIKPCDFSAAWINSCARYFLSRHNNTRTINTVSYNFIDCDCYTPNYNSSALSADADKLYAIVHANYHNTIQDREFPFIKSCLNFQKNFKIDTVNNDVVYFARRNFKFNPEGELYIDSVLSKFNYNNGSPSISDVAVFPDIIYGRDIDDEDHAVLDPIDEGTGLDIYTDIIDENPAGGEVEGLSLGDFELHGIWNSNVGGLYNVGMVNWRNKDYTTRKGLVELIEQYHPLSGAPYAIPYYRNISTNKLAYATSSTWEFLTWTDVNDYLNSIEIQLFTKLDLFNYKADLFLIKGWIETNESCIYPYNVIGLRGIIMRRHDLLSTTKLDREQREFLCSFALQKYGDYLYLAASANYSSIAYQNLRKYTFRIAAAAEDGYFINDAYDNSYKKWDGLTTNSTLVSLGDGLPCVEGDFGQYELSVKVDSPYEEIIGFSMGPRIHVASAYLQGGRNSIWKLSKSLAFHIAVADFSDMTAWDVLSQFAELTNSLLSFDRYGNLHLETRPVITSTSPYVFTFDKISLGNVNSWGKDSAFDSLYNYIEIIPSKPVLPSPTVDLITQSDISAITANHDLFITDQKIEVTQADKSKSRPDIKVYQKDYERKKILMICNNGQYDPDTTEKGLYSRWKYAMTTDSVDLRLSEEAAIGQSYIIVNEIPYDDVANKLSIQQGDKVYIGNTGPFTVVSNTQWVDVTKRRINLTAALTVKFESGLPVSVNTLEAGEQVFHASGTGNFQDSLTYSPKSFFTEIGEWVFDETHARKYMKLSQPLYIADGYIAVDSVVGIDPDGGYVSIGGQLIRYTSIDGNRLMAVNSSAIQEYPVATLVYLMPTTPLLGSVSNNKYSPGNWRMGGYDEIGPSCLNSYHLYDPNEDSVPYYDRDPLQGGKPITALEFYWKEQKNIVYFEPNSGISYFNSGYRNRHRTFVEMMVTFNNFKFIDGDKIDIDIPGIKLEQQVHLKKTMMNYESVQRNGLKTYPATNNRFFNNKTAVIVGERILAGVSNIGYKITLNTDIENIADLDFLKIVRFVDRDMLPNIPMNQVQGYVSSLKFNERRKTADIVFLTQPI